MDRGGSTVTFRPVRSPIDLSVVAGYSASPESEWWFGSGHHRSED